MRLRVKYRSHPKTVFRYNASDASVLKGEDAEKKELREAFAHHTKTFVHKKRLFGPKYSIKEKFQLSDIEAWIEDDGGNKIETLS